MVKNKIRNKYTLCPAVKALYLISAIVTMALAVVTPWFEYSCEVFKLDTYTISKGPIYIFNEALGFEGPLTLFSMDGTIDALAFIGPALMVIAIATMCVSVGLMCASKTTSALILNLVSVVSTIASVVATGVIEYSVLDSNLSRYSFLLEVDFVYDKFFFYPGLAIDYLGFALAFLVLIGIAVWAYLSNVREQQQVKVCVVKYSFGEVLLTAMKTWAYKLPVLFGLAALSVAAIGIPAEIFGTLCVVGMFEIGFGMASVDLGMTFPNINLGLNGLDVLAIVTIVLSILAILFTLGIKKTSLAAVRGEEISSKNFVSVWNKNKGKYIGGYLWYSLLVSLWLLIPVAGIVLAVIKAYQYRFVPYILVDKEDVSVTDAIKLSKKMTYGNRAKMFAIDMATIGAFTAVLAILGLFTVVPFVGTVGLVYFLVALVAILVFSCSYKACVVAQEYNLANQKYEEVE